MDSLPAKVADDVAAARSPSAERIFPPQSASERVEPIRAHFTVATEREAFISTNNALIN